MGRMSGPLIVCGILILAAGCGAGGSTTRTDGETRVLVVGTVHSQHRRNPNYTYEDVVHILNTYDPDIVCVEIRPEEFRKEPYLKEMMLATVWGVVHGREVCGFDWFDDSTRQIRARLAEQPEYVERAQVFDSLIATNPITGPFDERYGDFWRGEMDLQFYNGREYNRYIEEGYRISLAVYGDSPLNLHYELRNRRMMEQAWDVIRRHPGSKVALLTGSEHKHYFDRDLKARQSVAVIELESLLPLDERPLNPAIFAFLEEDDDLLYFESGYPEDMNRYYRNKITDLIHGPDMDWRPDVIPVRNVEIAGKVLARWRTSQPVSYRMTFDEAWFQFLSGDCGAAVERLTGLTEAVESGAIEDPFLRVYTYRNLGLCYDLLGERDEALRSYARARALLRGTRMEEHDDAILREYETLPYQRGRNAE